MPFSDRRREYDPLATARIESGVYTFMIGRIGFRRVLPILLTLVHLTLLYFAAGQRTHHLSRVCSESGLPPRRVTDKKARRMGTDGAETAYVCTEIRYFAQSTGNGARDSDRGSVFLHGGTISIAVRGGAVRAPRLVVWSGVGRWLDRLLGHISPLQRERRTWRKVFAVLSTIFLCLGILSITPANRHRTCDALWIGSAIILWSALFIVISILRPNERAPR